MIIKKKKIKFDKIDIILISEGISSINKSISLIFNKLQCKHAFEFLRGVFHENVFYSKQYELPSLMYIQ